MKQQTIRLHGNSSTIQTPWQHVQNIYNRMPLGITPCQSIKEAKQYTCLLFCILSAITLFFLPLAAWCYLSSKKGGRK